MREVQAINSKVNLSIETGLTMTSNNMKVQKKKIKKKQHANMKHKVCFHGRNKGHYIKECIFKDQGTSFKVNMVEKDKVKSWFQTFKLE
jgi:hypothetical protein